MDTNTQLCSLPANTVKTANAVFVIRGTTKIKFSDPVLYTPIKQVLYQFKQPTTVTAVLSTFGAHQHAKIQQIIEALTDNRIINFVSSNSDANDTPEAVFYWNFKKGSAEIRKKLSSVKLIVLGINEFSVKLFSSLKDAGFTSCALLSEPGLDRQTNIPAPKGKQLAATENTIKAADCLIAIASCNQRKTLQNWNTSCLNGKKHFFPILIDSLHAYMGPYVFPGSPACFYCASQRFLSNIEPPELAAMEQQFEQEPTLRYLCGHPPGMVEAVTSFACMEIINIFSGLTTSTPNKITDLCLVNQQVSTSKIIKIPGCLCGVL
jgi:bacteriocin biosynthesis cyclodehydratase domain-containing protein